jgi:hypothetical protein
MFAVTIDERVSALDAPAHLPPPAMLHKYGSLKNVAWSGKGAQVHRELLKEYALVKGIEFREGVLLKPAQQGWTLVPEQENLSKHVAAMALRQFESGELVDAGSLTAIYVRPSDAELKCP